MSKEKIDRHALKDLRPLVARLMAYEARQILIDLGKHKPISHRFTSRYATPPKKVKGDIIKFFQDRGYELPNTELLKSLSLRYLNHMVEFATANPSYRELKRKIENGEYDFPSVLEVNACS